MDKLVVDGAVEGLTIIAPKIKGDNRQSVKDIYRYVLKERKPITHSPKTSVTFWEETMDVLVHCDCDLHYEVLKGQTFCLGSNDVKLCTGIIHETIERLAC